MRASVLGTGHRLPARARVKVNRSAHFRRQPDRQPACMHCMHKNRQNFSDLCVIMHAEFWLAGTFHIPVSRTQSLMRTDLLTETRVTWAC